MTSNFTLNNNKIILKNGGEFFGSTLDFEYNIGDKLYDFAIMENDEFDKLKILYTELINIVCSNKECNGMDKKVNFLFEMFHKVQECLNFSPYTHFYTQTLIDIIIKTYNSGVFRSDLLFKNNIGVYIDNTEYTPNEIFEEIEENHYVLQTIMYEWTTEIDKISKKKHNKYIKFFETIKDYLIKDLINQKSDLKERLELISEYSNNSFVRNLSNEERLYLYEAKDVFDLHYLNTNPAHALFLDTKFVTKYICNADITFKEKQLSVEELIDVMHTKNIYVEEVYEINNCEEQIKFELFKVIQNNFTINKCENCGKLFIPITSSNNPNQKGRNDQKYCNNLYKDTGKTCKEIGALNKRKEKVENSTILQEYNREYKRMHRAHYTHTKEFKEKKFKEWSKKARGLRYTYTDEQIEEFKIKLKELSNLYWKS